LETTEVIPASIPRASRMVVPCCDVDSLTLHVGKKGITQQDVDKLRNLEMMLRRASAM
jgi:hypothetical protein